MIILLILVIRNILIKLYMQIIWLIKNWIWWNVEEIVTLTQRKIWWEDSKKVNWLLKNCRMEVIKTRKCIVHESPDLRNYLANLMMSEKPVTSMKLKTDRMRFTGQCKLTWLHWMIKPKLKLKMKDKKLSKTCSIIHHHILTDRS